MPTNALTFTSRYTVTVQGGLIDPRVKDLAGNALVNDEVSSFTTVGPKQCPCSIWDDTAIPTTVSVPDPSAIELGVKFQTDEDGHILGIRFYKSLDNTGTHIGNLWTSTGQLLATATFVNETASGWQEVTFSAPVSVTANTTYVASYHTDVGFYSANSGDFSSSGVSNPPLRTLADGEDGSNGLFDYGPTGFPTSSNGGANYWVDVLFATDFQAPTVTLTEPSNGAVLSGTVSVSATATDDVGVTGVQFQLDGLNLGAEDTVAPYTVSWDTTTALSGTHSLTVIARDAAGNVTTSPAVLVTIDNEAPTIIVTTPTDGAVVSGTVSVQATATDNIGIAGVQFLLDGLNLGAENTIAPYAVSWDTTQSLSGTHILQAVARDGAGNLTASVPISVTVDNQGPIVTLTTPLNGAVISGTVSVSAAATDDIGLVGVQFRLDGANLEAEDTIAPYSFSWDTTTVSSGTHTLGRRGS